MSNGKKRELVEQKPLPVDRIKTVEAGLAFFQQVQHECVELKKELEAAGDKIAHLKIEIEGVHHQMNLLESRVRQAEAERDIAVAERAEYAVALSMIRIQIMSIKLPETSRLALLNIEEKADSGKDIAAELEDLLAERQPQ